MTFNFKKMGDDTSDFVRRAVSGFMAGRASGRSEIKTGAERQRANFLRRHGRAGFLEYGAGPTRTRVRLWRERWPVMHGRGSASTEGECERRHRQIAAGRLTTSNGLVPTCTIPITGTPTGARARRRKRREAGA